MRPSRPDTATAGVPFEYTVTIRRRGGRELREAIVEDLLSVPSVDTRDFTRYKVSADRQRNLFDRLVGYPRWVAFMRERLRWDVLYVVEHDDLRRAPDARHFVLAREWRRTLVTLDRDYLDDRAYPPAESGGLIVLYAPTEQLLSRTLAQVDERIFRNPNADRPSPLSGRKLMADPEWIAQ